MYMFRQLLLTNKAYNQGLSWIQSNNTGVYINTGIKLSLYVSAEIEFAEPVHVSQAISQQILFGGRGPAGYGGNDQYILFQSTATGSYSRADVGSGSSASKIIRYDGFSKIKINTKPLASTDSTNRLISIEVNGSPVYTLNPNISPESFTSNTDMHLFAAHRNGETSTPAAGSTTVKVSRFRLWRWTKNENNVTEELIRDFIPVLDIHNTPCMYDTVTRTCFYNGRSDVTNPFNYGV